jgi:type VI secretion system FHA domain protein
MPASSTWEAAMPPPEQASAWSSAAPDRPPAPSADDVWGKIAEGNVVDWARGGFGRPEEVNNNPLGLNKAEPSAALPKAQAQLAQNLGWDAPAAQPTTPPPAPAASAPAAAASIAPPPVAPAPAAASPSAATPAATNDQLLAVLVEAAGLAPRDVTIAAPDAMKRAGMLLRRLIAGLVVMVEARARAKSQMGAEATSFEFDGNNPLKFARTPEQAIAQLLNPPQRGFMDTDRAIEDAFYDLQSHQMATLKAMQGALRATLARFSPTAIKQRAENKGVLARILPQARDAELWQNYEREFSGVAQGSDEAFMDVFAKEFRKAYEEQARQQRKR